MLDIGLLERLCSANAVSGNENEVRNIILENISEVSSEVKVDAMGNVIAFKKGKQKPKVKLMLIAHMDEVGFIITNVADEGFLKFDTVGGIYTEVIPSKNVVVGKNKVPGVIGIKPIHLKSVDERNKKVLMDDLYIDIGANSKEQALEHVSLGDYACFESNFEIYNNVLKSKAIDDRIGCYALINFIKSDLLYDTYFVFSCQEEVGLRGSKAAAYTVNPQAAIIVEATTAHDIPMVKQKDYITQVNEGVAISFMDRYTIYDKVYFELAKQAAEKAGVKYQIKQGTTGGNDAGSTHSSRGGVRTAALSLPCRYLHCPTSLANTNDLNSLEKTLKVLAEKIAGGEGE